MCLSNWRNVICAYYRHRVVHDPYFKGTKDNVIMTKIHVMYLQIVGNKLEKLAKVIKGFDVTKMDIASE